MQSFISEDDYDGFLCIIFRCLITPLTVWNILLQRHRTWNPLLLACSLDGLSVAHQISTLWAISCCCPVERIGDGWQQATLHHLSASNLLEEYQRLCSTKHILRGSRWIQSQSYLGLVLITSRNGSLLGADRFHCADAPAILQCPMVVVWSKSMIRLCYVIWCSISKFSDDIIFYRQLFLMI